MVSKREKLIDKLVKKDYNNKLEEILSTKTYKEEVKNLLLDILYKVETSYNDYSKVKVNTVSKEEYIQNIIRVVDKECDSIKFIRPNVETSGLTEKKTFLVDKENGEILCYPITRKLLYCISKIEKSEDIIKSENTLLNKTLTNTINVGNSINTVEPLRDFNGFSWNVSIYEIENLYYNLIYQDLIILVGNRILEEWVNKNDNMIDYVDLIKGEIERRYGKKISNKIIDLIKKISILLELKINKSIRNQMIPRKDEVEQELIQMENKEQYLENISNQKKKALKKIKRLDIIMNNKELLAKEYARRNKKLKLENKIFSIRVLAKRLEKEREDLLDNIKEYNDLMKSKNFLERYKKLQEEFKYLKIIEVEDIEKETLQNIIILQKYILKCFSAKIKNAIDKEEFMNILYEIRYYNLLPVLEDKRIEQIPKLSKDLKKVKSEALNKANELKMINEIFSDEKINNEILENIFMLEIIDLEDIYFKISKEKDEYYIQFFDEDVVDERYKISKDIDTGKLRIKLNKKMKLFI